MKILIIRRLFFINMIIIFIILLIKLNGLGVSFILSFFNPSFTYNIIFFSFFDFWFLVFGFYWVRENNFI